MAAPHGAELLSLCHAVPITPGLIYPLTACLRLSLPPAELTHPSGNTVSSLCLQTVSGFVRFSICLFFRSHMRVSSCIYQVFILLSLTSFISSKIGPPMWSQMARFHSFSWLDNIHYKYIPHLIDLFTCHWKLRLLPRLVYCK